MITITNSKVNYKAPDGGITRRNAEHFVKRTVRFEIDGEERSIDIPKSELTMSATEDDLIAYIEANIESSSITNEQVKALQDMVDFLVLENLMRG